MEQSPIKVYARANEQGQVTRLLNTIFNTAEITDTDIFIDEGYGDAYAYPHTRFTLYDMQMRHNYKLVDGKLTATTDADKAQENNSMEEVEKAESFSNPNLLINGGFDVWQRGESFDNFPDVFRKYTADRWYAYRWNQPIKVESLENDSPAPCKYKARITLNRTNQNMFRQPVEDYAILKKQTFTLSFYAKSDALTSLHTTILGLAENTAIIERQWKRFSATFNGTVDMSGDLQFRTDAINEGQGTYIDITGVKLELGTVATPFTPPDPAIELIKCKRYYEKAIYMVPLFQIMTNSMSTGQVRFSVQKRVPPTIKMVLADGTGNEGTAHWQANRTGYLGGINVKITVRTLDTNYIGVTLAETADFISSSGSLIGMYIADAEIY